MKKIEFLWAENLEEEVKEIFEYEDNVSDDKIQADYDRWLGEIIGNRTNWYEVE